uniref:SWIM-type domain-containing protein n=4 Tax=Caenorhabditis japonica TaxID=281687 RepID=A0A8R1IU60_CAEJA
MQPMHPNVNNAWNGRDDVSFEDSERFEEDSQGSLDDSLDGSQQNWRGWTDCQSNCEAIQPGLSCLVYQYHNTSGRFSSASTRTVVPVDPNNPLKEHPMMTRGDNPQGTLLTLSEISARICAEKWSFQQLEEMYAHICTTRASRLELPPPTTTIPEKIFLSFIVHCFPQATDEIRMYSTLANGSSEQFEFGKTLYEWGHVCDVSQTGFLLSGNVTSSAQINDGRQPLMNEQDQYHVTVKVDRCRIVECTCECSNRSSWCKHVVALCIYRITQRAQIKFK